MFNSLVNQFSDYVNQGMQFIDQVNEPLSVLLLGVYLLVTIVYFWYNLDKPLLVRLAFGWHIVVTATWIASWFVPRYEPLARTIFITNMAISGIIFAVRLSEDAVTHIRTRKQKDREQRFKQAMKWGAAPSVALIVIGYFILLLWKKDLERQQITQEIAIKTNETVSSVIGYQAEVDKEQNDKIDGLSDKIDSTQIMLSAIYNFIKQADKSRMQKADQIQKEIKATKSSINKLNQNERERNSGKSIQVNPIEKPKKENFWDWLPWYKTHASYPTSTAKNDSLPYLFSRNQ